MSFKPHFTITPEINTCIAEIEKIRTIVAHSHILPEIELHLRFRATVEAAYSSTTIEGNPLNRKQVEQVITGQPINAPDYAIREVSNYMQALNWLNKQTTQQSEINKSSILMLHRLTMSELLPKEKVGQWRPGNVYIVNEKNHQETVQYTGPKASRIENLIKDLLTWLETQSKTKNLHPVLVAGIFHYAFVSIHPFSDGNGRVTRLLTKFYLQLTEYDFRGTFTPDSYYVQNQLQYYQALSLGNTYDARIRSDITPFLDFFTKGFLKIAQKLHADITVAGNQSSLGKIVRLDQEEIAILDYTRQFGSISSSEVQEAFGVPYRTAQRKLANLVIKKLLKRQGSGPATEYVLAEKTS
ncbi:MAG TPA: Fic family protein [Patescibacteria group bacterium]